MSAHRDRILDQFTRQAVSFSSAPSMTNEDSLRLVLELSGASARDTLLDVACGPGIVVCAFAAVVEHATGIDLTPAMVERARLLQTSRGLTNVTWDVGDVVDLPYAEESFSIVTSRYAFHHLENPHVTLAEMKRVCRTGGTLVLIDQTASALTEQADALNQMERLRDPSHVRALPRAELHGLFAAVGVLPAREATYSVDIDLETLLSGSFPNAGDAQAIREMIIASLDDEQRSLCTRRENGRVIFTYPITILAGEKR